ncbi:odorant-binding protein 49a [Cochliomyia hominivorax]
MSSINVVLMVVLMAALLQTSLAAGVDCKKVPPVQDPVTCCSIPELITEENKENCTEFLIDSKSSFVPMANEKPSGKSVAPSPASHHGDDHHHNIHHGPLMHSCFMNCALNETGILENYKLNTVALSTQLQNVLNDTPDLIPILETSFKTCSVKMEKFHEKMQEKMKNRKLSTTPATMTTPYCPPVASHLMGCVFMETFINCPASVWNKTKECNELREHVKNCKPKYDSSEKKM